MPFGAVCICNRNLIHRSNKIALCVIRNDRCLSFSLFQSEYGLTEDQVAGELTIVNNSIIIK